MTTTAQTLPSTAQRINQLADALDHAEHDGATVMPIARIRAIIRRPHRCDRPNPTPQPPPWTGELAEPLHHGMRLRLIRAAISVTVRDTPMSRQDIIRAVRQIEPWAEEGTTGNVLQGMRGTEVERVGHGMYRRRQVTR